MAPSFRNADRVEAFVNAAVQLPGDRLRRIDREWDGMHDHRGVISELVQGNKALREEMAALRQYIAEAARQLEPPGDLIPEETAEAIIPAARALLLRDDLEAEGHPERAAAFAALTRPFRDILPGAS